MVTIGLLVALPYDWQVGAADRWTLQHLDEPREAIASADRRAGLRELSRLTQEFGGYDAELTVSDRMMVRRLEGTTAHP